MPDFGLARYFPENRVKLELIGTAEFAELANVTRQAVSNWEKRYDDFPEPIARLALGSIWKRSDAIRWIRIHDKRRNRCRYD